jgi:hypothetical protein
VVNWASMKTTRRRPARRGVYSASVGLQQVAQRPILISRTLTQVKASQQQRSFFVGLSAGDWCDSTTSTPPAASAATAPPAGHQCAVTLARSALDLARRSNPWPTSPPPFRRGGSGRRASFGHGPRRRRRRRRAPAAREEEVAR